MENSIWWKQKVCNYTGCAIKQACNQAGLTVRIFDTQVDLEVGLGTRLWWAYFLKLFAGSHLSHLLLHPIYKLAVDAFIKCQGWQRILSRPWIRRLR
jgi:hypothetical protein